MAVFKFNAYTPQIDNSAWIAHDANIIGNVEVCKKASVWFGPHSEVTMKNTNRQWKQYSRKLRSSHRPWFPIRNWENCTIGHSVILHGCTIADNTLIGMGSTILNGAKIGKGCLIGAGSLITENKIIPDGSLVMGAPGKIIRELDDEAKLNLIGSAVHYQERAAEFNKNLTKIF